MLNKAIATKIDEKLFRAIVAESADYKQSVQTPSKSCTMKPSLLYPFTLPIHIDPSVPLLIYGTSQSAKSHSPKFAALSIQLNWTQIRQSTLFVTCLILSVMIPVESDYLVLVPLSFFFAPHIVMRHCCSWIIPWTRPAIFVTNLCGKHIERAISKNVHVIHNLRCESIWSRIFKHFVFCVERIGFEEWSFHVIF